MGGISVRTGKGLMMRQLIPENEIEEIFVRSSGPGGQNVNKVSTAVCLRHRPTGIVVKAQKFRTQYQNRLYARELLAGALGRMIEEKRRAAVDRRESERRRNRKRPRALKERILELKKHRSQKKSLRRNFKQSEE